MQPYLTNTNLEEKSFTYKDLENKLKEIYAKQKSAFKINLGFGSILYQVVDQIFNYYYVSNNTLLFENAQTISNIWDLDDFIKKIMDLDLLTNYYLLKPSSSWVLAGLTNAQILIFPCENVTIGYPPIDFPDYLKYSNCIISMTTSHRTYKLYKDNKCFFRCLAYHFGCHLKCLERATDKYLDTAKRYLGREKLSGVNLDKIPQLELCFRTAINVYDLKEDGTVEVVYLSKQSFPGGGKPMYLNLYKNHFSYITNINQYAKKYKCNMCSQIFGRSDNLKAHIPTCNTGTEEIYVGGKFKPRETVFDWLEKENFYVPESDRYYKYFSVFDFEAFQEKSDEIVRGRKMISAHIPATFSISSNIPGHKEVVHIVSDGDPQKLVDCMVQIQLNQQTTASQIMRGKYRSIISTLEARLSTFEMLHKNKDKIDSHAKKNYKKMSSLLASLKKYCDQLPILGFNSQRYDIPLIRRYLPASLKRLDSLPQFVIKKTKSYMALGTKRLKYLDVVNYLAAGTSLNNFYKAFKVKTPKGCFPYEWFDNLEKMNYRGLPPQSCFYSSLSDKGIDSYTYMNCWKEWNEQKMKTFGDYTRYYNNSDVVGLVEGLEKMIAIKFEQGLDIFKESVSLASLTQVYLRRNLAEDDYFCGISEEHKHIYKDLKTFGIVGGPSIIFNRYQEANVTSIKGKNLCKKIIGFDANALYLSCLGREMPTGPYTLREKKNHYKKSIKYSKESIQWLEHKKKEFPDIRHAENHPHGEKRIGNFHVDGFSESTNTVFEYHGCYYHGHCKYYNKQKKNSSMKRERIIRNLGYKIETITSCEWNTDPRSNETIDIVPTCCTQQDIIQGVISGESFGFIKCDVHVPDHLISRFSEFPPIFKNTEIPLSAVGEHMQAYCRSISRKNGVKRSLISSMWGKDLVILTPLFEKYMEMGLICTNVEWILEFTKKPVFKWFMDYVTDTRRKADLDPAYKIRGETAKTEGNSAVGITMMDRTKHVSVKYATKEKISNHIRDPRFKTMDVLAENIFEIEKKRKSVKFDTAIQIGIAVYAYAKLNLINFWDFLNKHLDNDMYQILECDTDSLYCAFARQSIDDCVMEHMKESWKKNKYTFFSSEDDTPYEFNGVKIPFHKYDRRTGGKFKAEFVGEGMISLNSKVYHVWSLVRGKDGRFIIKTSCKGIQKKRNELVKRDFLETLQNQTTQHYVQNAGIISDGQTMKTYLQTKKGLGYFYPKRKVLADGISTTHLDI